MSDVPYPYTVWGRRGGESKSQKCATASLAQMYRDHYRRNGWTVTVTSHLGDPVSDAFMDDKTNVEMSAAAATVCATPQAAPPSDEADNA